MDNLVEPQLWGSSPRGFVTGASMLLLGPVNSLDCDSGTQMTNEIERRDGEIKQYAASSSGSAHDISCSAHARRSQESWSLASRTRRIRWISNRVGLVLQFSPMLSLWR